MYSFKINLDIMCVYNNCSHNYKQKSELLTKLG